MMFSLRNTRKAVESRYIYNRVCYDTNRDRATRLICMSTMLPVLMRDCSKLRDLTLTALVLRRWQNSVRRAILMRCLTVLGTFLLTDLQDVDTIYANMRA